MSAIFIIQKYEFSAKFYSFQKKHILQKFLKIQLKSTFLFEVKKTKRKNIAKNTHFVQKKCRSEKLIYIFETPIKNQKNMKTKQL
jgi:hypothetical protein